MIDDFLHISLSRLQIDDIGVKELIYKLLVDTIDKLNEE